MANPKFRADRLVELMHKRDLNAGQLAYLTGVSQPMVFYLTRDERPGVTWRSSSCCSTVAFGRPD